MIGLYIITFRDHRTGHERSAYVEAFSFADAEAVVEDIAEGQVLGELVETGEADNPSWIVGRA